MRNRSESLQARPRVVGLVLAQGTTFDEWAAIGQRIARLSSGCAWSLGDWMLHGERRYGRRYRMALAATNLEYQTLRNYALVARRFETCRRRDTLSFHHHAEVAPLAPAEQDLWLRRAESLRWSRNELRRQLAAQRAARRGVPESQTVIVRFEVSDASKRRWQLAAAAAEQELLNWVRSVADDAAAGPARGAL